MINQQLISPESIVVVGASEDVEKPGGKVLKNILQNGFKGKLYGLNHKKISIDGVEMFQEIEHLPAPIDLAIISIPASACLVAVKKLIEKGVKAFILFSSGFGEAGEEGKALEKDLVQTITAANACLIGPNCVGVINQTYKGVFTSPIPTFYADGCELISSSGATAVFIMEAALSTGLRFSNVYSIGNGSQTGIEEILEYLDKNYVEGKSPKVKLLYLESIRNPFKFLKHASSLIHKGCKIAAIKSGHSEAGSRAATSHTGAMSSSDTVVRALFRKAGIVYCSGRAELISVGCLFQSKEIKGNRIAIVTHAGGSAVMLTDALCSRGMEVPAIESKDADELLKKLNPGSTIGNPIDFLATGTAEQLGLIIDFCENLPDIDGIIVVFGSPGLFNVKKAYELLDEKMNSCKKPIYPVLPSLINAKEEIAFFLSKGNVNFPDEVVLGSALPYVFHCKAPHSEVKRLSDMADASIRNIINQSSDGYLSPEAARELTLAAGIKMAEEAVCLNLEDLLKAKENMPFPLAMKVIGPIHKTEVKGVSLHINSWEKLVSEYNRMLKIEGASGVVVQEMVEGEELFIGAAKEGDFGHLIICGLGGIHVEVFKDISFGLAPLRKEEALEMVES
ncbi:MAG: acetate--CoA ligase family protein, partial [Bacteroidia bacterium]|nr:acetate--CoA ligase family protein [Bacteroidia bacterium]MCF8447948.1 acetate--CoA ligase family protein [Bacteroidia bacterium]